MQLLLEPDLDARIKQIAKKNPRLLKRIQKQLNLFSVDPKHPSLRNHKLKGGLSTNWSISIEGNIRMLYYMSGNLAIFYDIGTHDEVYRKK